MPHDCGVYSGALTRWHAPWLGANEAPLRGSLPASAMSDASLRWSMYQQWQDRWLQIVLLLLPCVLLLNMISLGLSTCRGCLLNQDRGVHKRGVRTLDLSLPALVIGN